MTTSRKPAPKGWSTVNTAANFLGMTTQGLRSTYLPLLRPEDIRRNVNPMIFRTAALIEAIIERRVSERTPKIVPDDPDISGPNSPALERLRTINGNLAELNQREREGELINRVKCRDILSRWGVVIRKMGDRVSKRFGAEANQIVNEAIDECDSVVRGLGNADA